VVAPKGRLNSYRHPLHLGIIFLTNLEIGYSHPPLGLNLFLGSLRFQRPITRLCRASWPFLLILLVALARFTYIPDLSLGLVHLLGCADLSVFRRCREIIKASPLFLFRF
jgi:TRAP-type C4-dicarboxylate transport system permease large subunit